jgi:hypothetical protein
MPLETPSPNPLPAISPWRNCSLLVSNIRKRILEGRGLLRRLSPRRKESLQRATLSPSGEGRRAGVQGAASPKGRQLFWGPFSPWGEGQDEGGLTVKTLRRYCETMA